MPIFPLSTLFHYPILLLLADGKEHTREEMVRFEIKKLTISDAAQKEVTPKGKNKLVSWTSYAISDLKQAGYIEHSGKGYVITSSGLDFFNSHKEGFMARELTASAAYRKYKNINDDSKQREKSKKNEVATSKKLNKSSEDGVVYILKNPAFKTFYIKIGFTTNINDRLKELYNTSVPLPFVVYALLKTNKYKQAEKMMHSTFKDSRIGNDREFFYVKPEEALEQMKVVAEGLEAVLTIFDDNGNEKKTIDYSK